MLSSHIAEKTNRFQIDKLEERIAPGGLLGCLNIEVEVEVEINLGKCCNPCPKPCPTTHRC